MNKKQLLNHVREVERGLFHLSKKLNQDNPEDVAISLYVEFYMGFILCAKEMLWDEKTKISNRVKNIIEGYMNDAGERFLGW